MANESPVLKYPFADTISEHAPWLEQQTRTWLDELYPSLPPEIKEKYRQTATGYLTARFFPFASAERLVPLAQSSLWGLAFDDVYEYCTPDTYAALSTRLTSIIQGESLPLQTENEFFHQMHVMAEGFRKFMPQFWMERFARSMKIYFEGMAAEAPFKAVLKIPTLEQYVNIRWRSVDVLQMVDGLEVATEMPLPDQVRHHPQMEEIARLTCRIIAWANDFFSVGKEQSRDVMNLVLVLQHQQGLSRPEAIAAAVRYHDEDVNTYLYRCQHLPEFGSYNDAVQQFINYNNYMIAGHWRWYITDTKRYLPGGAPTDQFRSPA
ncbi:Terpene synthase family, metal binding domain [Chitinophaga eiseniae]|uniref:Terpene synthase n=1 Tax=Chitinophaga eiseniae TaxID=634771 RepID=A0A1T4SXA1_9BACT|nr:terpene synthase family protein [Chitinophaga eiseniae]SKA32833.1 Terpene synthase family, metal binding domain [Chitinophaga eiseniae]